MRERELKWLRAHSEVTPQDLSVAKRLNEEDMLLPTGQQERRIKRMLGDVRREYHYLKSFIRFVEPVEGVLIGYASPEHRIKQMLSDYFARRFPGNLIIVGDERSFSISLLSHTGWMRDEVEGSLDVLVEELAGEGGRGVEGPGEEGALWRAYYWSQYDPRRRNPSEFKGRMPDKYRERAGLILPRPGNEVPLEMFCEPENRKG